jgi:hypothetical protein
MRKTWIACLLSGLFVLGSTTILPGTAEAADDSISGQAYLMIQVAMPEFENRGLDISRYRITVQETKDSRYVIFIDADVTEEQKRHGRGNPGKIPGFEVELARDELKVVRSNFIR